MFQHMHLSFHMRRNARYLFDTYRYEDDSDVDFSIFIQNLKTERDLAVRQLVVQKEHGIMIKEYLGFKSKSKRVSRKRSAKKSRKRVSRK